MCESIVTEEQHEVLVRVGDVEYFNDSIDQVSHPVHTRCPTTFPADNVSLCLWGAGATRSAVCLPAFVVAQFELLERAIGL
jgi:hypothetical protein